MSVLHALVVSIAAWNQSPPHPPSTSSAMPEASVFDIKLCDEKSVPDRLTSKQSPDSAEIRAFFIDYRQQKEVTRRSLEEDLANMDEQQQGAEDNDNDNGGENGMDETPETVDEKLEVPDHIKLVIEVLLENISILFPLSFSCRQCMLMLHCRWLTHFLVLS